MNQYVDKSLARGETIVMRGRWPLAYWIGAWSVLIVLGLVVLASLAAFGLGASIVALLLLVLGGVWFVIVALHLTTTDFAVTNQRVLLKRGWLTLSTQELAVGNIEEVRLEQSLLGKLFGFGRVIVTGTGEGMILFPPLAEPIEFRRAIENARTQARGVGNAAIAAAP